MIIVRDTSTSRIYIKNTPPSWDAGTGPFVTSSEGSLAPVSPTLQANFLTLDSYTTPAWLTSTAITGNRMVFDNTGALTWAPGNMVTRSQEFNFWATGGILAFGSGSVVDATTAPNGTMTADLVTPTAVNEVHRIFNTSGTSSTASNVCFSVYVSANGYTNVALRESTTTGAYASFSLSGSGSVLAQGTAGVVTAITPTITDVGGGWFRISMAMTQSGNSSLGIGVHILSPAYTTGNPNVAWLANGTSGMYLWGAQVEQVTYQTTPRTYIPTATAAVYLVRYDYDWTVNPATAKGALIEQSRINRVLRSNDFTNAAWVKSNITAAKDEIGIDNVANGASSLLCDVANGTVLQSITLASSARYQTCYVKRLAGTGVISMTMDGGTTWVDVTSQISSSWARVFIPTQTVTDPQVGFKMATINDKIAVQYFQNENGVFATSPIPTVSAAITRSADIVQLTGAGLTAAGAAVGSAIVQTNPWENSTAAASDLLSTSTSRRLLYSNSSNTAVSTTNGTTNLAVTIGGSSTFTGSIVRSAISWNSTGRYVVANNGPYAGDSVNLSTGATVTLGGYATTTTFNGWVSSMALYGQKLSGAQLQQKSAVNATY